jgi:hypothetical protein
LLLKKLDLDQIAFSIFVHLPKISPENFRGNIYENAFERRDWAFSSRAFFVLLSYLRTFSTSANDSAARRQIMSTGTDISALYSEFTHALTEVLAETAGNPARRGRLARARAAVKKHPEYNEHEYFLAIEAAFTQWEAMQNIGR